VKNASAKDLVEHINRHGMTGHVVIYSGRISKEIPALDPRLRIMPEARNAGIDRYASPQGARLRRGRFKPEVIAVAKNSKRAHLHGPLRPGRQSRGLAAGN
jgi:hypothetical protein